MKELIEFLDKYNVKYTVEGNYIIAGDIDLYNKGITELPLSIGNIRCDKLDLNNNQISVLPESIGNLECNNLYLGSNKISVLPESFGNIKCNALYLGYNQISILPESIGNLRCNVLCLDNNQISELPESIGNIKCDSLYLQCNQISVLPESIGNIKCNALYLNNNQISELPESIGNIKCDVLSLTNNQIIELPESIGNIKCNELYLSGNNLIEIPKYGKYRFNDVEITDQYINCDGIFSWYESIKTVGEYTVYIGYYNEYIVTKDNTTFAHGNSIRQGISDLIFKVSDRDKSNYINLDKDTELSIEQAIVMYRVITGACSSGVEGFLRNKDTPETVTVNYILNIIGENDYGYKEFREFFK